MRVKISRGPAETGWLKWLMRRELNVRTRLLSRDKESVETRDVMVVDTIVWPVAS